jgi:hypothetical protein
VGVPYSVGCPTISSKSGWAVPLFSSMLVWDIPPPYRHLWWDVPPATGGPEIFSWDGPYTHFVGRTPNTAPLNKIRFLQPYGHQFSLCLVILEALYQGSRTRYKPARSEHLFCPLICRFVPAKCPFCSYMGTVSPCTW